MRLLLDTDAFCILAIGDLLRDALRLLGADLTECGRLPALPHMLRRGRLRKVFGSRACDAALLVADTMPLVPQPSAAWLDRLTPVPAIDPGEAQIFAAAAELGLAVVSGDKRALRAIREIEPFVDALAMRIAVLEAVLLALCDDLGADEVRRRILPLAATDKVVAVCFSEGNPDPREALLLYYHHLAAELSPLILWNPRPGEGT